MKAGILSPEMLTPYHAKYFAHELTKRCPSDSIEKLASALVDDRIFGDLKSFKEQFANLHNQSTFETLKARLQPLCKRTLRRQVLPYVRYTKRPPMVQPFTPSEGEDRLYYLRRDNLQALPASQRSLMTLVLRKLLASSSFAIAGALNSMSQPLRDRLRQAEGPNPLEQALEDDFEALDEIAEEWEEGGMQPEPLKQIAKLFSRKSRILKDSASSPFPLPTTPRGRPF